MSYGLYKYIVAKELSGSSDVTYRIELLKNGYSGSSEQLEGAENYFEHTYNKIDPRNPFENPVQASQLTMSFHVQGQSELDLLEEIFGADENQYILQKKVNGSVVWQGKVLNDLLEYDEGDYPFPGRIIAKDLSYLKGVEYPFEENDEKIITTLAGALNELGFGLNIYTYTNWVENNQANTSDDFLNQVYNDTYAFRNYGSSTEQDDTAISQYDVIDRICRNYNLILRQSNNAWHLFHISALDDPTSVKRYVYNSSGVQQSSSNVDLTIDVDSVDLYVLPFSGNRINPAVKKANVIFEHRTGTTQTLVNASRITRLTDPALPVAKYSIPFNGSGDEYVEISGRSYGTIDTYTLLFTNDFFPRASYLLKSSQYYWCDDSNDWLTYDNLPTNKRASIAPSQIDLANNRIQITDEAFRHGDVIRVEDDLTDATDSDTEYYLIDVSGDGPLPNRYYQLSEEPDGTPITFTSKDTVSHFAYRVNNAEAMNSGSFLPSGQVWWYDFNITTTPIPSDSDTDIQFYAMAGIQPPDTVTPSQDFWEYFDGFLYWIDTLVNVKDPTTANGDSFLYELEQNSGNYSTLLSYPGVYFGDGPLDYSRSALLVTNVSTADTPTSQWDFVGGSTNSNFFEIWLKEVLNVQRTARRNLRAELYGEFEAYQVLSHDSKYFFFLGGTQRGNGNRWDADFFEIDIETGTDTFVEIVNAQNSAGTGGSGGGTSASAEGLTVDFADARYLQISNDLSDVDDASTARTNLGLEIGTDVQAQNELLEDISGLTITDGTFLVGDGSGDIVAESGNTARTSLGLGTGDSPTFAGLTINGNISVTGNVDGRDVSADGTNLDTILATGVQDLTSTEVDQLENIDSVTISNTQWGYLGALDQGLTTTSDVQFDDITLTGIVKTNEIDAQADLIWNTATEVFSTSDFYANNAVNIGSNVYITDELDVAESLTVGTTLDVGGNTTLGGTLAVSGNSTLSGNLTLSGSADFNSTMNLQGALTTQNTIQSDNFDKGTGSSGWIVDGATGFAIEDNSGVYDMYVDSLTVRGSLRVFELIAKQISAIGGTEILSVANGVAESVTGSAGSEVVTLEDPTNTLATSFADFDLVLVQRFNPNNPNSLVKQEFRTVSVASGLTITLTSTSGAPAPSDAIEPGDFIVAYGSTTNASTRGNIIYRNVEGQPVVRLQTGINSYSAFASPSTTTRIAYGDLDGFSGQSTGSFGFFAGDDSAEHILIKSDGLFFKDDSTVLAELTSNTFKVGDGTNFLSFDGTDLDIQTDTFTLETTNLSIDSANELITLGSADSVSIGKKTSLDAEGAGIEFRDSLDKYATTVDFYGLYLDTDNYFGFVIDNDGNVSDGYNFRVGGSTSNYIEVNSASGDVGINFDTFDLTSGNLRIKSGGTSYPSADTGNTSNASTTGNYAGVNVERLDLTINSGKWIKFQFDYDHNTSGTSNFQCDFTVEIQHEVSASWSSIGVSDDIFYLLNPSYAYVDVTAGASLSVTDDSTTTDTKLRFQSAGSSDNSYTGTITFYFYVFDKGSTDALRLNFIDNSTSINSLSTDIDGVEYNPVTELNPNGIFVRLSDSIINSNGNTYQDISLITNA